MELNTAINIATAIGFFIGTLNGLIRLDGLRDLVMGFFLLVCADVFSVVIVRSFS